MVAKYVFSDGEQKPWLELPELEYFITKERYNSIKMKSNSTYKGIHYLPLLTSELVSFYPLTKANLLVPDLRSPLPVAKTIINQATTTFETPSAI